MMCVMLRFGMMTMTAATATTQRIKTMHLLPMVSRMAIYDDDVGLIAMMACTVIVLIYVDDDCHDTDAGGGSNDSDVGDACVHDHAHEDAEHAAESKADQGDGDDDGDDDELRMRI